MAKSKILGVLGGLGPMASVYFYELLTRQTQADCDQEHIDLILSSKATTPDRTAFILGKSSEDPFAVMEAEAQHLVASGAEVLAIPCNTAHHFYSRINNAVPVPVLHMVEDSVDRAIRQGSHKVGILATDGTVQTGTYQHVCKAKGLDCVLPNDEMQALVMHVIYNEVKRAGAASAEHFKQVADTMFSAGCDMLLLACTELSLVKRAGLVTHPVIDSMEVLAESAILACGKTPRPFHWCRVPQLFQY